MTVELKNLAIEEMEEIKNELKYFAEHEGHPNAQVMLAVADKINFLEKEIEKLKAPVPKDSVHRYFGLSYADYLVVPRSVLQSMPSLWQQQFTDLLEEMDHKQWRDQLPEKSMYQVKLRNYGYEYDNETEQDEFQWKKEVNDPLRPYDRGRRNVFEDKGGN